MASHGSNKALDLQGLESPPPCDVFCQAPFLSDFHQVAGLHSCADVQPLVDYAGHFPHVASAPVVGGHAVEDRLSARRVHKADREKLRRDRLNEHFGELATVLDPDRPKNDKATILGDSVQAVKDLRSELKRLKSEHSSLMNESHDLTQEKNELREEKTALKNEAEQLQSQLQQRLRALFPWMTLDPSLMMGAATFPYTVPIPQPTSMPSSNSHQTPSSQPLVNPIPYIPFPPLGAFPIHPSLQPFAMFGGRPGDGNGPYFSYPSFQPPIASHSHVERPYAQYPSSVQPFPGYAIQTQPSQGAQPQVSSLSEGVQVPGIPAFPTQKADVLSQKSRVENRHSHVTQANCYHVSDQTHSSSDTLNCLCQPVEGSSTSVGKLEPIPENKEGNNSIANQHKVNSLSSTVIQKLSMEIANPHSNGGTLSVTSINTNFKQEHTGSDGSENVAAKPVDLSLHPPAS